MPPHASGMPRSTSGIEKRRCRRRCAGRTRPRRSARRRRTTPGCAATVTARISSSARPMRHPTWRSSIGAAVENADRSAPAENDRPAPLTTTTFRSWCSSNQRAASSISCSVWLLSGFSLSGRFSVQRAPGAVDGGDDGVEVSGVHRRCPPSVAATVAPAARTALEVSMLGVQRPAAQRALRDTCRSGRSGRMRQARGARRRSGGDVRRTCAKCDTGHSVAWIGPSCVGL